MFCFIFNINSYRYQSEESNSYVILQKTIKDLNKEERSLLLLEIEKCWFKMF